MIETVFLVEGSWEQYILLISQTTTGSVIVYFWKEMKNEYEINVLFQNTANCIQVELDHVCY